MSTTKQTQANTQAMSATESQQVQALTARVEELEQLVRRLASPQLPLAALGAPFVPAQPAEKAKKAKTDGPKLNKDGSERKKRRTSGWELFCASERPGVRSQLEAAGEKVKATEVTKELGAIWGKLGDEGKEVWNAQALALVDSE
jgi:hypothetical protein